MATESVKLSPKEIFEEYKAGNSFKESLGAKGIFEQSKINERFYVGDQWYGAQAGNTRPLVRLNIIKLIGDHKIATVGAAPVAVNYNAEGVPSTVDFEKKKKEMDTELANGGDPFKVTSQPDPNEVSYIMSAMSDYFSVMAERIKFNDLCLNVLQDAFVSTTAFLYGYWDPDIMTGLYADEQNNTPINGDVNFEVLNVENVNVGDPNKDDVQSQPYIIISQRKALCDVKREAKRYHQNTEDIKADKSDTYLINGGDRGETEPSDSKRVTVLTKLWKEYDNDGKTFKIYGIRVTENATVRPKWELGITRYPLAKFSWVRRKSCFFGDSEVTYLIPNQIAINRALTASVWATMNAGMPKLAVSTDAYNGTITNDPGQILRINNLGDHSIDQVIKYLQPPAFAGQFQSFVEGLVQSTLKNSGLTDAVIGNVRPENATAILQAVEASRQPLQIPQGFYHSFVEDVAKIACDFWVNMYGDRQLKVLTRDGTKYIPFHADRYKKLVINAKVDVSASVVRSEAATVSALDGLLGSERITFEQYLKRLPKGLIPDVTGLIEDQKQATQAANDQNAMMKQFAEQYPQEYDQFVQMPPEQQQEMLQQITANNGEEAMI